jgi:hypothetical protein
MYKGSSDNDAVPLYVYLKDVDGDMSTVVTKANATTNGDWQEWNIPTSSFVKGGFKSNEVAEIYVGCGDRAAPPAEFLTGTVYVDDIVLHVSRCVREHTGVADFSGDCVVDITDLGILADGWLKRARTVSVSEPCDANLIGHWGFEETSGAVAADDSGSGNNATVGGGVVNLDVDGVFGGSGVKFELGYMDLNSVPEVNTIPFSYACWIKRSNVDYFRAMLADWHSGDYGQWFRLMNNSVFFALRNTDGADIVSGASAIGTFFQDYGWHHVAGVWDREAKQARVYVDGVLESTGNALKENIEVNLGPSWSFGYKQDDSVYAGSTEGYMDEFYLYNCALSDAEVAYLASNGTGNLPLRYFTADLYDDEKINFNDYALFIGSWLDEYPWP